MLRRGSLLDEMMGIAHDCDDKTMATDAYFMRSAFELWRADLCAAIEDLDRAISINGRRSSAESESRFADSAKFSHKYVPARLEAAPQRASIGWI